MKELIAKIKMPVLILGDIFFLYFSLWIVLNLRLGEHLNKPMLDAHYFAFSFIFPLWIISFYIFGLYDLSSAKNTSSFYWMFLKATILNGLLSTTILYLFPNFFEVTPKTNLFLTLLLFGALSCLWRYFYNFIIRSPNLLRETVIIGKNSQTNELVKKLNSNPQLGYRISSVINIKKTDSFDEKLLYSLHTLICPLNLNQYPKLANKLYRSLPNFNFETFPNFYEKITKKVPLSQIDEIWFLNNLKEKEQGIYEKIKRIEDIIIGSLLGAVTIIAFPFVALAIKLDSSGPVFYKQIRIGKNGKEFNLIKFRSMKKDAEKNGAVWAIKNDSRITRVGHILRKTLIDELPQFLNILKGEISFIGSRPERPEFIKDLEKQIHFYQARHLIKPGLTGWAQINFKYGNSKKDALEKLQYELYYIKNRSLLLDLKIILKTINILLKGGTL